ncbi:MAG: pyridoxamine 5'-phosphate oxidase family protein [Actinomycetota bacterium]|nr:pyridoxamine 5'-phosphate oxidase family protein [Actinomycetota bacterium]
MSLDLAALDAAYLAFWRERHLCTLTTLRPDGTLHVVPVGAVFDPQARLAWVIASRSSRKVRNVLAYGLGGGPVALCQVDGVRWATLEGRGRVRMETESVEDAERRYAERYRPPRRNPERVVVEIEVTRAMGRV